MNLGDLADAVIDRKGGYFDHPGCHLANRIG